MGRITIVLNDKLQSELRKIQAKQLMHSTKSVSFSRVLNETLAKALGIKI